MVGYGVLRTDIPGYPVGKFKNICNWTELTGYGVSQPKMNRKRDTQTPLTSVV